MFYAHVFRQQYQHQKKTIENVGESLSISVKATYQYNGDPNLYKSTQSSSSLSVTTGDGITIAVTAGVESLPSNIRLVVRVIPKEETEAYNWFSEVLKEIGSNILPLDIYFEKDGQIIPINTKIRITITLPDGYTSPIICYVTTEGKVEVLHSTVNNGKISFETNHTSYYVLADKVKNPVHKPPQTGDNVKSLIFITLMMLLVISLLYNKRRKESTQ